MSAETLRRENELQQQSNRGQTQVVLGFPHVCFARTPSTTFLVIWLRSDFDVRFDQKLTLDHLQISYPKFAAKNSNYADEG